MVKTSKLTSFVRSASTTDQTGSSLHVSVTGTRPKSSPKMRSAAQVASVLKTGLKLGDTDKSQSSPSPGRKSLSLKLDAIGLAASPPLSLPRPLSPTSPTTYVTSPLKPEPFTITCPPMTVHSKGPQGYMGYAFPAPSPHTYKYPKGETRPTDLQVNDAEWLYTTALEAHTGICRAIPTRLPTLQNIFSRVLADEIGDSDRCDPIDGTGGGNECGSREKEGERVADASSEEHPLTATILHSIGELYRSMGKNEEALVLLERGHIMRQRLLAGKY